MEIRIINLPYLGDLYRFYVNDFDDVIETRLYHDMSTAYTVIDADNLSDEIQQQLEQKLTQ